MNEQNQQLESLQEVKDIRRLMERSSRFISLSGLSGVAISGADTIPVQTLINSTNTSAIATYTAVATYGSCSSQSATYDISVLPTPDVVLPPAQSICSGSSTAIINLSSNVSGTTFTWTGQATGSK